MTLSAARGQCVPASEWEQDDREHKAACISGHNKQKPGGKHACTYPTPPTPPLPSSSSSCTRGPCKIPARECSSRYLILRTTAAHQLRLEGVGGGGGGGRHESRRFPKR